MYNLLNLAIMKTIDEILNRNDYQIMTAQLKERVEEIAHKVRLKLVELDLEDKELGITIKDANGCNVDYVVLHCASVTSNSCGSYEFLGIDVSSNEENRNGWRCLHSLEDVNKDYYYAQDYNAPVHGASNKEALRFLNAAPQLFKSLDEIEEKQVQAVKDALEKTKNL